MNSAPSRLAIALCILWFIPLLIWLLASLHYQQWQVPLINTLLHQAVMIVFLLQCLSINLFYSLADELDAPATAMASMHMLLFPLPLITIAGLTQSLSPAAIGRGYLFAVLIALVGLTLHYLLQRWRPVWVRGAMRRFPHLLVAILVWNGRADWQAWVNA